MVHESMLIKWCLGQERFFLQPMRGDHVGIKTKKPHQKKDHLSPTFFQLPIACSVLSLLPSFILHSQSFFPTLFRVISAPFLFLFHPPILLHPFLLFPRSFAPLFLYSDFYMPASPKSSREGREEVGRRQMGISAHVGWVRSSGESVVELQGFLRKDYCADAGLRL